LCSALKSASAFRTLSESHCWWDCARRLRAPPHSAPCQKAIAGGIVLGAWRRLRIPHLVRKPEHGKQAGAKLQPVFLRVFWENESELLFSQNTLKKTTEKNFLFGGFPFVSGDLGGIQTRNLLIRSQMLYSVELRGLKNIVQ
jgi:hypothetical protein